MNLEPQNYAALSSIVRTHPGLIDNIKEIFHSYLRLEPYESQLSSLENHQQSILRRIIDDINSIESVSGLEQEVQFLLDHLDAVREESLGNGHDSESGELQAYNGADDDETVSEEVFEVQVELAPKPRKKAAAKKQAQRKKATKKKAAKSKPTVKKKAGKKKASVKKKAGSKKKTPSKKKTSKKPAAKNKSKAKSKVKSSSKKSGKKSSKKKTSRKKR